MNKGKELLGMTSRPRRRVLRVSENYDDNHLWEDSAVYAGEKLRIHATKWQDPVVPDHWGIREDFNAFAAAAGLLEFSLHPRNTYEELSREFLSTFRFEGPENYKHNKKRLPGSGSWRRCNLKRSPKIQKCKAISMVSSQEVEVVDTVTT